MISICARITSHSAIAPDHPAVVDSASSLTYAELERQSNQLAAALQLAGAGPERCIGLFLERSVQFVVAALAVLKTGAAYLPLDPSTPADRATFILADAGALVLLSHRGKAQALAPGTWRVLEIDDLPAARATAQPAMPAPVKPDPGQLVYVIYTSGSTGRPKGVEITHANLSNLIQWHQAAFGVTAADRASQVAGLGFDAAAWEIWPHLTAGASLHLADEVTRRSPQALRDWLVAERITISFVPTVLAEQLLHANWPAGTALRFLLTGADMLRRWPPAGLPFTLVNNYGPTECTVVATSGTVAPNGAAACPPSIGRAITNAMALILDDGLRPVRPGDIGELCIGGALVGRGYRNNPALTASQFVTYWPASGPSLRVYRTGDRARLLPCGEIDFLGRMDEQVKIRGYRIELGEIVACLDRFPGIEACAVLAREADGALADGPLLVAYVVAAPDARLTASGLREFLAARLPEYMIPTHYVRIAELRTTPNGKCDKSALPAPTTDNLLPNRLPDGDPLGVSVSSPSNGYHEPIAALVASLLGQPSIDPEENFFLMGGHSMLGAQLLARISDLFGVKVTLRQLFNAPTANALAAEIARLIRMKT